MSIRFYRRAKASQTLKQRPSTAFQFQNKNYLNVHFFIKFSQTFPGFSGVVFIALGTKESNPYKKAVAMQLLPSKIVHYDKNISENRLMAANQIEEGTAFLLHLL